MATESAQPPRTELQLRCAWCGRVRRGEEWVVPDELDVDGLTHGICPECAARLPLPPRPERRRPD